MAGHLVNWKKRRKEVPERTSKTMKNTDYDVQLQVCNLELGTPKYNTSIKHLIMMFDLWA
jgi:hypothetical protein